MPSFSPKLLENATHYDDTGFVNAFFSETNYEIILYRYDFVLTRLKYVRVQQYREDLKFIQEYFAGLWQAKKD